MLKILVVDDSLPRTNHMKRYFDSSSYSGLIQVHYCDSADKARMQMLEIYDLLILDVVIPKKNGQTASAKNSSELLKDVCEVDSEYLRPNMIVGLTANINELGVYRQVFMENATIVLDGSLNKVDWLDTISYQIESLLGRAQKEERVQDKALITIHGIRTNGKWQQELVEEVKKYSRSFNFIEVKYGFFDLISFVLPWSRARKIREVAAELVRVIEGSKEAEVNIVAHSFGTLIVAEAFKSLPESSKVNNVILCGSPMCHGESIDHIVSRSERTVNECGVADFVLLIARLFAVGLGDAGRIGFAKANTSKFVNRYYKGGHGLYFGEVETGDLFVKKHWLPILLTKGDIIRHDERLDYLGQDVVELVVGVVSSLKAYLIGAGVALIAWKFFSG